MSSVAVRTAFKNFLSAKAPSEKVMDLTALYEEVNENLANNFPPITPNDPWLGIQFIGEDETPATVPATNSQGRYRETGAVFLHIVAPARMGVASSLLTRAETLRNIFRGERIGSSIIVRSMTPPSFDNGATLEFDDGWISGSFLIEYTYDNNL